MNAEEIIKFQQDTWTKAADGVWNNIIRLTATPVLEDEKLEDYVKRVRVLQDAELEKFRYAVMELRKAGKEYE